MEHLVECRHAGEGEEGGGGDGEEAEPARVLQEVTGLHPDEQEVAELLAGVDHHSAGQADQRVHREQEALLLVRLRPEDGEPEVERRLAEPVRQEDAGLAAALRREQPARHRLHRQHR